LVGNLDERKAMEKLTSGLVNNAGVAENSFKTTPAGFEVAMGVKYLFRPVSPKH
jgi:hypothetical protein